MSTLEDQVASTYNDFVVAGIPASGPKDPLKSDIRTLLFGVLAAIDSITVTAAIASGAVVMYANAAAMNADLAHPAGTLGIVTNDSTDTNNGIYYKIGSSGMGSWSNTGLVTMASIRTEIDAVVSGYAAVNAQVAAAMASATAAANSAASAALSATDANNALQTAGVIAGISKTYTTYAQAVADLSNIGNNAYVLVLNDESHGNQRSIYQKVSGSLVLSGVIKNDYKSYFIDTISSLSSLTIPSYVMTILAAGYHTSGDIGVETFLVRTSQSPGSPGTRQSADGQNWILARFSVRLEMFGAIPGAGNDVTAAAIEAVTFLSNAGGGSIEYVAGRDYPQTNIPPGVKIRYWGGGRVRIKENMTNTAHTWYGPGLERGTYHLRNWKQITSITPGNSFTMTTPSDAAHFPVGSMVAIISTNLNASGTDWQPDFSQLNRIISANSSTGVVTVEEPIPDNVGAAQMALQNDFSSAPYTDQWAIECVWEGLIIDLTDAPTGTEIHAWFLEGMYKCQWRNNRVIGCTNFFAVNGFCYSKFYNNVCEDLRISSSNSCRWFEIKTGSLSSQVVNNELYCSYSVQCPIANCEIGEYADHITIDGVLFIAPEFYNTYSYMVGTSGTPGDDNIYRNIRCYVAGCNSFISTCGQLSGFSRTSYKGHVFENCYIKATYCAQTVRLIPSLTSASFRIRNIELDVSCVNQNNPGQGINATPAGIMVPDILNYNECTISEVVSNGPLYFASTGAYTSGQLSITNCKFSTYVNNGRFSASSLQAYQLCVSQISRFGEELMRAGQVETVGEVLTISATTPTVVGQSAFAPYSGGFGWANGDGVELDYVWFTSGTAGAKTVTLHDVDHGTDICSVTIPASPAGAIYRMTGQIYRYDSNGYAGWVKVEGGSSEAMQHFNVPSRGSSTAQMNFTVYASVAVSGDLVNFIRQRTVFKQFLKDLN